MKYSLFEYEIHGPLTCENPTKCCKQTQFICETLLNMEVPIPFLTVSNLRFSSSGLGSYPADWAEVQTWPIATGPAFLMKMVGKISWKNPWKNMWKPL